MPKFTVTETAQYIVEAENLEDAKSAFLGSPVTDFPTQVVARHIDGEEF